MKCILVHTCMCIYDHVYIYIYIYLYLYLYLSISIYIYIHTPMHIHIFYVYLGLSGFVSREHRSHPASMKGSGVQLGFDTSDRKGDGWLQSEVLPPNYMCQVQGRKPSVWCSWVFGVCHVLREHPCSRRHFNICRIEDH